MSFQELDAKSLTMNPFSLIGDKWMLITSGNQEKYNTMTASWGSVGVMWGKNVVFAFIRPQRYTFEFVEKEEYFTLSFYPDEYKKALSLCGKVSGRDVDKAKEANLTPIFDEQAPYFEEANLVLVCKKLYAQNLSSEYFCEKDLDKFYPIKDYHKMFVGEIVKVLAK